MQSTQTPATGTDPRNRAAATLQRYFIAAAQAGGLTGDLKLTFDGGRITPSANADMHIAEFHANGMIVRKRLPDRAITDIWLGMDLGIGALREAVGELCDKLERSGQNPPHDPPHGLFGPLRRTSPGYW